MTFAGRFSLGLFEGVTYPAIFAIFSQWIPTESKGHAIGILQVGSCFGAVSAFAFTPVVSARYGWRVVFWGTGALGLCLVAAWKRMMVGVDQLDGAAQHTSRSSHADYQPVGVSGAPLLAGPRCAISLPIPFGLSLSLSLSPPSLPLSFSRRVCVCVHEGRG